MPNTSLSPNTTYVFSGYVKHSKEGRVEFEVQLANREVAKRSSTTVKLDSQQTWRFINLRFKTGPKDTTATVMITKKGPGTSYVDDTGVVPAIYGLQKKLK